MRIKALQSFVDSSKKLLQSLQHPINNQFNLPTRMLMKKILGSKRIWLCVYVTKWIEDDRTYVSVHKDDEEYIIKNDSVVTLQGKRYKKLKANKLYLIGNASDGPYIKSIKYITCIYLNVTTTVTCKSVKVKAFILNDIFHSSQSILSLIVIINKLQCRRRRRNFFVLGIICKSN